MRRTFRLLAVLLACAILTPSLGAQTLRGKLVDEKTGEPVTGVAVTLLDSSGKLLQQTRSDTGGTFVLSAASAGTYSFRTRRIGYKSDSSPALFLRTAETLEFDFLMTVIPISLSEQRITARRQYVKALDSRTISGRLIRRRDFEKLLPGARDVIEVIRWQNIPGVHVQLLADRESCLRLTRERAATGNVGGVGGETLFSDDPVARGCMEVYVNDARVMSLQDIDPQSVETIVVLKPGEAGALFGTGAARGVLLIYTLGRSP
ncbi:MAG: carboxypeptidase regulatory-like domain-containing protein [Gemmatimonadaceae bacterium]|nr:carboxypeptidase regulatory-like domain-containing protein [Gemmatimonadaceae bacterium]